MTGSPRVVLALPAYNRADALPETVESLLAQTFERFALVIEDDSTTDDLGRVASAYVASDARLTYERNPRRLGMIANWRRCYARARALHPDAEYFAWVSDHDVWHPRWLEALVAELDAHPDAVLAYPQALRRREHHRPEINRGFETSGLDDPHARLRKASVQMMAGNMIYGLFRANALGRAGVFRRVLMPDRQVLLALSLLGEFRQVRELLWYREIRKGFSKQRQRDSLFGGPAPIQTYLPTHLTHAAVLAWDFGVCGRGRPAIGRARSLQAAALQWWTSVERDLRTAVRLLDERFPGWVRRRPAEGGRA
ncbi:MAG: glycosyltransferase family 2 protein [Vicinamibacterales bacterium]